RSLQCRARSGRIESDSAVGRAQNPCSNRSGRERMIGKQRVDRVEERESAVEVIHLRPARRRRLRSREERGAVVLKSRQRHCAVSWMRTDRIRLGSADARIEGGPGKSAGDCTLNCPCQNSLKLFAQSVAQSVVALAQRRVVLATWRILDDCVVLIA